jgi:adenosine deaminase
MKRIGILLLLASTLAFAATIDQQFQEIRKNPLELYAFLYRMPKGGDLHNHLIGAVYAESLLKAAAEDSLCVDRSNFSLARPPASGHCQVDAGRAQSDNDLTSSLIDSLSMRDFEPGKESPADHFFNTFYKFSAVAARHNGDFVAEVARRAGEQNESYLELMALAGAGPISELGKRLGSAFGGSPQSKAFDDNFDQTAAKLRDGGIAELVAGLRAQVDQMEERRVGDLACKEKPDSLPCQVRVRYIFQVLREFPKEQVFAQALAGFMLANEDPRVVAVNFVQPEHGLTAMRDYHLHMRMVDYMHRLYPRVHIALHAGELASGLVPPEGLRFHIREAIEIGHAERIGHGVSVMYENDALGLLHLMKQRHIAVEINLTSNDLILGVRGANHPLPVYRKYGVPIVLSTDDEGVSRTHLTQEYQRAVLTYGLSYADLKTIVRNSIEYSFLPPGEKARARLDLEKRFQRFEQTF